MKKRKKNWKLCGAATRERKSLTKFVVRCNRKILSVKNFSYKELKPFLFYDILHQFIQNNFGALEDIKILGTGNPRFNFLPGQSEFSEFRCREKTLVFRPLSQIKASESGNLLRVACFRKFIFLQRWKFIQN